MSGLLPGFTAPGELPRGRTARRTALAAQAIANGRHPLGAPLAGNGETCGSCVHARSVEWGRTRAVKCDRLDTRSEATDIRRKWPACVGWEARP